MWSLSDILWSAVCTQYIKIAHLRFKKFLGMDEVQGCRIKNTYQFVESGFVGKVVLFGKKLSTTNSENGPLWFWKTYPTFWQLWWQLLYNFCHIFFMDPGKFGGTWFNNFQQNVFTQFRCQNVSTFTDNRKFRRILPAFLIFFSPCSRSSVL